MAAVAAVRRVREAARQVRRVREIPVPEAEAPAGAGEMKYRQNKTHFYAMKS